jgi:hypothetical protein
MTDQTSLLDRLKQFNKGAVEPSTQVPAEAPKNGIDADGVAQRMRDLGRGDGINPPEEAQDGPQEPPKLGPMPPPPGEQEGAQGPPAASEDGKTPCPHCGKRFKHLSKHRCKLAPGLEAAYVEPPAEAEPRNAEPPPPVLEESSTLTLTESVSKPLTDQEAPPMDGVVIVQPRPVQEAPATSDGYLLLIDAIYEAADDTDIVYLGDIVAPLCEAVARENRVEQWQLVEYARGPGFLAQKLEKWIVEEGVEGAVYLDSMTAEGKACKEVLRRHARAVIQGVR